MQEQQEKVPKVVKNFDVMLTKYIGNTVVDTHPNMNESFRTLVHKKNKFYLLLWTLANGDYCRLAFKQKAKWAYNFHLILRNQGTIYDGDFRRCSFCAAPFAELHHLQRHTETSKPCEERYDFMNFNGVYVCQFGCDGEYTTKGELAMHLILDHKSKEVSIWGYKKDVLKKLLSREQLAYVLANDENNIDVVPALKCSKQSTLADREQLRKARIALQL